MSDFVHLQNHTDYSLLEAITTIQELVSKAKENNQKAIALTDNGVMYGIYEFYKECKKQEIKPLYGMDAYIAEKSHLHKSDENKGRRDYSRLLILAKNNEGYKNLTKLCSIGFIDGFYYKPRIDFELLKEHSKGLIITSGSTNGEIAKLIINSNSEEAKIVANRYKDLCLAGLSKPFYYRQIFSTSLIISSSLFPVSSRLFCILASFCCSERTNRV